MENLAITGTIKKVLKLEQITDSFSKQEFILETGDTYPQKIKFETVNDKTELLKGISKQIEAKVYFNVRGREWINKENKTVYFVSLQAWKIETVNAEQIAPIKEPAKVEPAQTNIYNDDLPF
ncbi:DUF3127 domain-containing protein [bacterium]|nr:DUF3127 domain-containing protein [bacterium]